MPWFIVVYDGNKFQSPWYQPTIAPCPFRRGHLVLTTAGGGSGGGEGKTNMDGDELGVFGDDFVDFGVGRGEEAGTAEAADVEVAARLDAEVIVETEQQGGLDTIYSQ